MKRSAQIIHGDDVIDDVTWEQGEVVPLYSFIIEKTQFFAW